MVLRGEERGTQSMKHLAFVVAVVVALGGCNKSPEVQEKNASLEQVANAVRNSGVADDLYLKAGEWRVSGTLEEMNIPGLPPEAQEKMKQVMGQHGDMTYDYCLTPEQAKRPGGKFFSGKAEKNCRYDHFTMGGGKIDAVMRCAASEGAMTMSITGSYSPESYSTHVAMNMEGGPSRMTMKMRSEAHRTGQCTPEDEARAKADSGTKG